MQFITKITTLTETFFLKCFVKKFQNQKENKFNMLHFKYIKNRIMAIFNKLLVSTKEERYRENIRKAFHALGIIMPFAILFFSQKTAIILLVFTIVPLLIIDYNNFFIFFKKNSFLKKFILLFRENELKKGKLTGLSWLLIGMLVTISAFDKRVVALSFVVLIFGDAFAALVGKNFGKIKLCGSKTFEGLLAFIVSSLTASFFFIKYVMQSVFLSQVFEFKKIPVISTVDITCIVIAILFSAITELIAKNIEIDDNFAIPVIFCTTYQVIHILFY